MKLPTVALLLTAGILAINSCQGNSTGPTVGTLLVATNTTGTDLDADGYTVVVNEGAPLAIGVLDTVHVDGLEPGLYQVGLDGVSTNCSTEGNPREVSVPAGDTTAVNFTVTCVPRPGGGDPQP